ncbi:polymorphic toxin-type HINT domain-containing protein [Streptomyces sp. NBC_00161]|uniref:polymorphic toxin-type HINT domain-containing protein n=1 Tax=Streptomyces sp. NBC_00161 TaxID=2975671 RepID=UPI003253EC15
MRHHTGRQAGVRRTFALASRASRGLLPLALLAGLVSAAPAVADDPSTPPSTPRAQVLQLWKSGGLAVKAAAGTALTGPDEQVSQFLSEGQKVSEDLDLRAAALTLVTEADPGVSAAAAKALSGTPAELAAFMKDGWKKPLEEDQRVTAARATESGGAGVRHAGDAAMNGTIDDIRAFLSEGQYKQRDEDARVRVAQIEEAGGPATKRAAAAALNAGTGEVRDFLAYGQYIARAQDQEYASVSDLAQQTADAATAADKAKKGAEEQAKKAENSAALAKKEAAKAAAETLAAKNDAQKAENAARRAAESSRRAAAAAKTAIAAARAANAAAQTAVAAAANASYAAMRASRAASNAWDAAASGKVNEKAAADALEAADKAEKIANSLDAVLQTALAASRALSAALGAVDDMNAAAQSSEEAAKWAAQSGADAAEARAAAASARRHADEAKRASQAAQAYAADAVQAATQARDAARSAAAHARKAAEAARRAADHAGDAQAAANQAKINADEALKAAQAAGTAVTKAQEIQATTRKGEADEIAARTALLLNEARDAKEITDTAKAAAAKAKADALKLQTDFDTLAADAAKPDAQPAQIATSGRRMALAALQIRGPWSRAAAEVALAGNDDAVVSYARTGWKQAADEDERENVNVLAKQSPYEGVRGAAATALTGTPAQIHDFLTRGQYQAAAPDNRIQVARLAEGGGAGVKQAAQNALDNSDPKALDTFLNQTQYTARIEDYRVEGARLAEGGGPEVKAAAEAALASPDTNLITFIESGQLKAKRRDQLNAAHLEQIQGIIATASANSALAYQSAYDAAKAAETAQGHADLAAGHAQTAADYAKKADGYATQARQAADRASGSANAATASAAAARKADLQAQNSARRASNAAAAAEASYSAAQGYAASAFQAAEQARQSAVKAGESASQAVAKAKATLTRYQTERYTAEQQARLEQQTAIREADILSDPESAASSQVWTLIKAIMGNDVPPGMSTMEFIHLKLDMLGLVPGIGEPADGVNCIAYAVETNLAQKFPYMGVGDENSATDTLLSCAAMMPVGGWIASGIKGSRWASKFGSSAGSVLEAIGKFFKRNPCSPNSFPAGTLVLMGDGSARAIEHIRSGDQVQAADPISGRVGARRVVGTIYTPDDRDFTGITISGAGSQKELVATDRHPFWNAKTRKWVDAGQLATGDSLQGVNGSTAKIAQVRRWSRIQAAYNLTVDELHTYFVLAGNAPVLVHNSSTSCPILSGDVRKYIESKHSVNGSIRTDDKTYWTIPASDWNRAINEVLKRDPHGIPNTNGRTGTIHRAPMPDDIGDEGWIGKAGKKNGDYELDYVEVILNPDGSIRNAYPWAPGLPGAVE